MTIAVDWDVKNQTKTYLLHPIFYSVALQSEFCDPCVVGKEATRVVPLKMRTNTINSAGGDMKYEYTSTYQQDFQCWEGSHAPESYNEIESYKPPTEPMMCETNQRAHFKGKISTHRHI